MKKIVFLMLVFATFVSCQKDEVKENSRDEKNYPSSIANTVWKSREVLSDDSENSVGKMTIKFQGNGNVKIEVKSNNYKRNLSIIPKGHGFYDYENGKGSLYISTYALSFGDIVLNGEILQYRILDYRFYFKKPTETDWTYTMSVSSGFFDEDIDSEFKIEGDVLYMDNVEYIRQ